MKIAAISEKVTGLPFMTVVQASAITELVMKHNARDILELGFLHGVSTCYLAGAVEELGGGHVTTIDLESSRELKPNAEELLESLGLSSYATVIFEPTSYTWRLMKMIEEDPEPRIDLCYIDGAHNWYEDGFAFFLVDRLLRPGGWVVFDDLRWNYATSPSMKGTERVAKMPPDERETRQLRNVFDLLVKQHPSYGEFREKDGWGYARKLVEGATGQAGELRTEVIHEKEYVGLGAAILTIAKRLRRSF